MFLISLYIGTYYNIILSWAFFYIFSSFSSSLPWSSCDNWWNTHGKCSNHCRAQGCPIMYTKYIEDFPKKIYSRSVKLKLKMKPGLGFAHYPVPCIALGTIMKFSK